MKETEPMEYVCDGWTVCGAQVRWLVYSPGYPMPMARTCDEHLAVFLHADQARPGAASEYSVRPVV